MSKKDILQTYFNGNAALTARNILIVLAFALVMAAVIFVTYRLTHSGTAYSAKLNATNVAITLITTVIMLMISSNIVISLGMVGALSIIRFRTAVKDPWDTVYIFWAVVEGLCVGSQNFKLALLSVLFIAVALILLSLRSSMIRKYLVVIRADETADPAALAEIVASHCKSNRLRAANQTGRGQELIYEVSAGKQLDPAMLQALKSAAGVTGVNYLEQTGETVG